MADVKAIIQDCSVGFSIMSENGCSVYGTLMPETIIRHHSSVAEATAVILSVVLAISAVSFPTSSPYGIFIQSISYTEVELMPNIITLDDQYIMTSEGLILFVSESNG